MEVMSVARLAHSDIQLREVDPVDVQIRNLSVTCDTASSTPSRVHRLFQSSTDSVDVEMGACSMSLLQSISTEMPRGTLTAIIGASGSGKTTLLNVLAQRLDRRTFQVSGTCDFNGSSGSIIESAYVMQQDSLIPSLTPREILQYGAELRLRDVANATERDAIVEQIILELSLKDCASTRIGSSTSKGCSGGEKRRTSIGLQLLQNPSVLFCDEVTTGLDSTSAFQIVQTLKDFARRGRTVIMTIHQPRSEIWELFDRVVVLSQGSCVFNGETKECLPYFGGLGYPAPPFVNPAEFLIDLVAINNRVTSSEKDDQVRVARIKSKWTERHIEKPASESVIEVPSTVGASKPPSKVSTFRQFSVMAKRSILVSFRDPKGLAGTIAEAIVVGIILGSAFYQLDDSLHGIRSRQGAFYSAAAIQGYLMLVYDIHRCCEDFQNFDREYSEGVVNVAPFLLSRRAAKAVEDVLMALLYSTIFYFMVGLRGGADHFFVFFTTVLLIQLTVVSLATFAVSVFRDFANAAMVGFAIFGASQFAGGCFLPANKIPVYVSWMKWTSYIYYAYGALNNNEFSGRFFECRNPPGVPEFGCDQFSGAYQLRVSGISLSIWQQLLAMIGLVAVLNLAAGLVLLLFPVKIKMSKKPHAAFKPTASVAERARVFQQHSKGAKISLDGYSLDVHKRRPWGTVYAEMSILNQVSTVFEPGKLNIIMGPSGSGKTTLLSSLANRLRNTLTTKYEVKGDLRLDGKVSRHGALGSMVSLVTQEDDGLLPCLTVRETLRFAAALRLHDLPVQARHQKAEEILLKIGLKDCADTLVGNELIKGLSGGEKRRLSIAIQLLTAPEILLLDEPTSGLDHYTAKSIVQLLTQLAKEGRTVILTIHQNRSDLSESNVLLLARGGQVAYSGPGKDVLTHFKNAGFECPIQADPADFMLDLITIDLRHGTREADTRKRADELISTWSANAAANRTTSEISTGASNAKENAFCARPMAPFMVAFPTLYRRSMLNLWRERNALVARIMNIVPYGALIALFFAPLHTDYQALLTRMGLIQLYCFLYYMGTLNNVAHLPLEKRVLDQEIEERAYSPIPFFASFTLIELPLTIVASLIMTTIATFPLGIKSAEVFLSMSFDSFALITCGESLALAMNSVISDSRLTLSITNIFISIAQTMAGILNVNMPTWLQRVNYISPLTYVSRNLMPYFFRGVTFDCNPEDVLSSGACRKIHGDDILRLYRFNYDPKVQLAILAGVVVGYRVFAFLVLCLAKRSWR